MKIEFPNPLNFSYEFFPPKAGQSVKQFWQAIESIEANEAIPDAKFYSITYAALGADRTRSIETVLDCQKRVKSPIAAHITAAGQSRQEVLETLRCWHQQGVKRLVILRGDSEPHPQGFEDAIALIKAAKTVANFDISVAAYPEVHPKAKSLETDIDVLEAKLDAGAKRAISQFFFDASRYLKFRDALAKRGLENKVIPGILPIQNFERVISFGERCGTEIPQFLHNLFDPIGNDFQAQKRLGVDLATFLCADLISEGVTDFHLYTLNTAESSQRVVENLSNASCTLQL
jgi:methylenetetrahydrofolate reductase (NADPH)